MSALTDAKNIAESIADLSEKCALLVASLKQAEEAERKASAGAGAGAGAAAMPEVNIDALAEAIAAKIARPVSLDIDLWGADEIARYLKMSKSHVMQRYIPMPGFPRAIRLPTNGGHKSHPRWKAAEVVAWADRYQDKKRAT